MKFLIDTSPANFDRIGKSVLIAGQLITPLTGYTKVIKILGYHKDEIRRQIPQTKGGA